jgi:hypothetical protein
MLADYIYRLINALTGEVESTSRSAGQMSDNLAYSAEDLDDEEGRATSATTKT